MTLPAPIVASKVIAVARGMSRQTAPPLGEALLKGGLSVIEVTLEGGSGLDAIAELSGGEMTVGAGTVINVDQAEAAIAAGAEFLVSPHLDPLVIEWAVEAGVPYLPGVLTPTEVAAALSMGVETVKVFPASVVGPDFIKALHGPFPGLSVVPTGGISAANAKEYLQAGASAVGVGGWLTGHGAEEVTRRAIQLRQVV